MRCKIRILLSLPLITDKTVRILYEKFVFLPEMGMRLGSHRKFVGTTIEQVKSLLWSSFEYVSVDKKNPRVGNQILHPSLVKS